MAAAAAATSDGDGPNVEQVIVAFWQHAETYYRDKDGQPTGEAQNFLYSLRVLRRLFGTMPAAKVDSETLEACRDEMIAAKLARNTINRRIGRIRQMFKWAAKKKMVPAAVFVSLTTVEGLKANRSKAHETERVKPVADAHARAVIAAAGRVLSAMVELQLLTGMRSGEVVTMRTADIERGGDVWVYTPRKFKTQHLGHERPVYLGKRCQEILTPFLKMDGNAYLFSPAEAEADRLAARTAARKTPAGPGRNAPGTNRNANPVKKPGNSYTVRSYAKAVYRACARAFHAPANADAAAVKAWKVAHRFHPHQLRHAAATRFRREYNLDTARALRGQKTMEAAAIYAEMDNGKAREVMRVSG
ncbi:MAG TPA: site-specific integrase [Tepidisphaeraceae bacterium]|jgi:integrase